MTHFSFIDLFAGLGGIRLGFEQAATELNVESQCVMTSEIKKTAIEALKNQHPEEHEFYDIYDIKASMLPNGVDVLLGGFPCQPFSAAGKGLGFMDTRGTLFFEIERLIKEFTEQGHKPQGFILENVEGLYKHGGWRKGDKYGKTLTTIVTKLQMAGYNVEVLLLNASDYGVPQARKRVYIVGIDDSKGSVDLSNLPTQKKVFAEIMDHGLPTSDNDFAQKLFEKYSPSEIEGKCIKDKRGGGRNIHSWDLGLRGYVSEEQKELLNKVLLERRKKKWANIIGIDWMDGMPLTKNQIQSFYQNDHLQEMLDDLVQKGYMTYEHPKKKIILKDGDFESSRREYDESKPKGYNIVTGKLSFEFSQIIDSKSIAPTLVAMDMERIGVIDGNGIRHLSINEGLKLFGYDNYNLSYLEKRNGGRSIAFDLLGNSVCVPVIKLIASRLIKALIQ